MKGKGLSLALLAQLSLVDAVSQVIDACALLRHIVLNASCASGPEVENHEEYRASCRAAGPAELC